MKICVYYTCGFPDIESSSKIFEAISEYADYIEVGIPFSDPIADGPVIQFSSQKALERGFKVKQAFPIIKKLSEKFPEKKFLIMTYYNIIFKDADEFLRKSKESGVWGLVIPDLPPGEDSEFENKVEKLDIKKVFFVSPTTPKKRIKIISKRTSGFIYYITVKGVTGERDELPEDIIKNINVVRGFTNKEILAGFGISKAEQIKMFKNVADGVIIGSAIIRKVIESGDLNTAINRIKKFLEEAKSV